MGPAVPYHFQYRGGRKGVSLDLVGGGRHGRSGRVDKRGASMRLFLCGRLPGTVNGPGLDAGRVQHHHQVVWKGGATEKFWEEIRDALTTLLHGWDLVGDGL